MKPSPEQERLLADSLDADASYQQFRAALRGEIVREIRQSVWRRRAQRWLALAACLAAAIAVWVWDRRPPAESGQPAFVVIHSTSEGLVRVRSLPRTDTLVAGVGVPAPAGVATTGEGLERLDDDQLLELPLEARPILLTSASGEKRLLLVGADGEGRLLGAP